MEVCSGNRKRGDLIVRLDDRENPLNMSITSSVESLFGEHLKGVVEDTMKALGITTGNLIIEDDQALDFVIKARVIAAVQRLKMEVQV